MGAAEALRGKAGAPSSQEALGVADGGGASVWGYRTAHPRFLDSQSVFQLVFTARRLVNLWQSGLSARTHVPIFLAWWILFWSPVKAPFFSLTTGSPRVPLPSWPQTLPSGTPVPDMLALLGKRPRVSHRG